MYFSGARGLATVVAFALVGVFSSVAPVAADVFDTANSADFVC